MKLRIHRNPAADRSDLPVLYRKPFHRISLCKMGDPCTGIYSDDDADGL